MVFIVHIVCLHGFPNAMPELVRQAMLIVTAIWYPYYRDTQSS